MQEHHIPVRRTARYHTLGDFDRPPRQVWFVCHGYRQLAGRFLHRFAPFDDGTRLIVAPEALSRFYLDDGEPGPHGPDARIGASWMTREDREAEIEDYIDYLDALHDRVFSRVPREGATVRVLGFSQGAATASRWLARGRASADHLILWAAGPAHDIDLEAARERFGRLRLTLVAGMRDALAPPAKLDEEAARLRAAGIGYERVAHMGGHELDTALLERLTRDDDEGNGTAPDA